MLNDALDRPILAGAIPSFQYDQYLAFMPDDVALQLDQLDLQSDQRLLIGAMADMGDFQIGYRGRLWRGWYQDGFGHSGSSLVSSQEASIGSV
jgi:hypothetical protein